MLSDARLDFRQVRELRGQQPGQDRRPHRQQSHPGSNLRGSQDVCRQKTGKHTKALFSLIFSLSFNSTIFYSVLRLMRSLCAARP